MEHDTAGDPMTGLRWTRKTTGKIANQLASLGISVSPNTVARLLQEMGFSLRVNHKKVSNGNPVDRDAQFDYISQLRGQFSEQGEPAISVDTKKKELVGNFKNPGEAWNRRPVLVNDHDFRSMADGIAVPYGIYDLRANQALVFIGDSRDTAQFTVDCIEWWWRHDGTARYPEATRLLILADGGGGNGRTNRSWKLGLQEKLCDRHGIAVTVCHYPPGASKWNPIEHRLFSEISKNWAGRPLGSYDTILNYIRTTSTASGLKVDAQLLPGEYPTGVKVSDDQMDQLALEKHKVLPKWNYTLRPR